MSDLKHTKGNWKAYKFDTHTVTPTLRGLGVVSIGNHEVGVAYGWTDEETIANAKLIAAAPELLEALQSIVAYEERGRVSGDPRISDHWFNICTKAIKKATE